MTHINNFIDRCLVINLRKRIDRWDSCLSQFSKLGIEQNKIERFEAHGNVVYDGRLHHGHLGCTASHRGVLELIAHHRWPRTLVLEDDFKIVHDDFQNKFAAVIEEVPADWDMLYLGGSYGNPPKRRISTHVIGPDLMITTSSYIVTHSFARFAAPYICGVGPIDHLMSGFGATRKRYILQPRLMVQIAGYSDLEEKVNLHPEFAMLDENHEKMV